LIYRLFYYTTKQQLYYTLFLEQETFYLGIFLSAVFRTLTKEVGFADKTDGFSLCKIRQNIMVSYYMSKSITFVQDKSRGPPPYIGGDSPLDRYILCLHNGRNPPCLLHNAMVCNQLIYYTGRHHLIVKLCYIITI